MCISKEYLKSHLRSTSPKIIEKFLLEKHPDLVNFLSVDEKYKIYYDLFTVDIIESLLNDDLSILDTLKEFIELEKNLEIERINNKVI